jgi:Y-X(10)_GDL-associated radical SAM protein
VSSEIGLERPRRFRTDRDYIDRVPVHVVWELTLACNLRCSHCGSRAGKRRPDELTTSEALDVVDSLARLGTRELSIIGGEAYLRRDWTDIVARAAGHGIFVTMQTGARALTMNRLRAGVRAGLKGLGVSIDGLCEHHDRVRGVPGSFENAWLTLERARELGLTTSVNTQIGPHTTGELSGILERMISAGAANWQVQLTVAMGNAVDNPDLLLQPYQLLELMPLLAELYHRGRENGVVMVPGNNIGYFGPYEHLWRAAGNDRDHWTGCSAGETTIGIESDGTVKGCPSLATVGYAGGNVGELSIEEIWDPPGDEPSLQPASERTWGFCGSCYYRDVCRGGCTWTSHSLLGKAGNNPYCHHRVLTLAEQGRRERVMKVEDAPDSPFAVGRFVIVEEGVDGDGDRTVTEVARDVPSLKPPDGGPQPIPPRLRQCRGCRRFVHHTETTCPFCSGNLAEFDREHEATVQQRREVMNALRIELALTT